ncbi:MAG: hypothetical protein R3267_02385 [Paenisporosarcina sp.]|nr:hypothetical protein [Paenisporosarcina sp.]
MSKTLANFMGVVAIMLIVSVLYYGITYQALEGKHKSDVQMIDSYQIQPK